MTSYEMRNQVQELIRSLRPKLSDNSIKTYCTTICALHRKLFGETFSVENFIVKDKMSTVLKSLESRKPSARKAVYNALYVCTNLPKYRELMMDDIFTTREQQATQEKLPHQKENWISAEDVAKKLEFLKDKAKQRFRIKEKTSEDIQIIQNYVLAAVLCMIAPRRCLDYCCFKIRNVDKKVDNYLYNKQFHFNCYKTAKFYGKQSVDVPDELIKLLKKWKKVNPHDYLLVDISGQPLNACKLNHRLNRIFDNRKISVNQLRHTYLSDKYGHTVKTEADLKKDLSNMGTSELQRQVYIKV